MSGIDNQSRPGFVTPLWDENGGVPSDAVHPALATARNGDDIDETLVECYDTTVHYIYPEDLELRKQGKRQPREPNDKDANDPTGPCHAYAVERRVYVPLC